MRQTPALQGAERMARIEQARAAVLREGSAQAQGVEPWIARSWQRCLSNGQRPEDDTGFDLLSVQAMRRTSEANQTLVAAASPVLERLGRVLADTRYFAILTNAAGVVVDCKGPIDRSNRHADVITRIGVDLSERSIGTSAISASLSELHPVWLHRGEHFFNFASAYSCAGAPVIGPDGQCVGMLDLTGVHAVERPELRHLAAQSARSIENALTLATCRGARSLLLRINWPGQALGSDNDAMVSLDGDGWICGCNPTAHHMLAMTQPQAGAPALHANDFFALPYQMLFDAARQRLTHLDVPLWSGLHLTLTPVPAGALHLPSPAPRVDAGKLPVPLKTLEDTLIRQAVQEAKGNVAEAARALGISRATVYRKLAPGGRGKS